MADEQDALLREIDEDLKQERLAEVWNKYGNYAIAGALAVVLGVAGTKAWQAYDLSNRQEASVQLADAQRLADDGKTDDALAALEKLRTDGDAGYAMLAQFRAAALTGKKGDPAKAAEMYAALADDNGIDAIYRDLAVILGALQELEATPAGGKLTARAADIAKTEGPWKFNAQEVQALAALAGGDKKAADEIFQALSKEAGAPRGLRARAAEMIKITGNN